MLFMYLTPLVIIYTCSDNYNTHKVVYLEIVKGIRDKNPKHTCGYIALSSGRCLFFMKRKLKQ